MKYLLTLLVILTALGPVVAPVVQAQTQTQNQPQALWQYGRIESVKKSVTSSTKAWVVNTPLDEERTLYTIAVHLQDRMIVGNYEVSATQSEPLLNGPLVLPCRLR